MTATVPEDPGVAPRPGEFTLGQGGNGDEASDPTPVVRRNRGAGQQQRRKRRQKLLTAQIATTVVFVALIAGLGWVGYEASLRITGGGGDKVTDPEAPGYVADVKPTAVDLAAVTTADGRLASVLVTVPGEDGTGGTVVALPPTAVVPEFEDSGPLFLYTVFEQGGIDGLRTRLGAALTFGFSSAGVVDAAALADLAAQVGPITIDNADNILERDAAGNETVRYRAGPLTLQPEEIPEFLAFAGVNEPVPNQSLRQQAVWKALLGGLQIQAAAGGGSDDGAGATEGSEDDGSEGQGGSGFLDLVPDLVAGDVMYDDVPLARVPVPGTLFVAYQPDPANLGTFVARTVPFPVSGVPGQRARVRLLNGTDESGAAAIVSPKVVQAGGEITQVGNAESFDLTTSRVEYSNADTRPAAEFIAAALGLQATRAEEPTQDVDVDVVIGTDVLR